MRSGSVHRYAGPQLPFPALPNISNFRACEVRGLHRAPGEFNGGRQSALKGEESHESGPKGSIFARSTMGGATNVPRGKRALEGEAAQPPSKKRMATKPARWTVRDDDALRAAIEASSW